MKKELLTLEQIEVALSMPTFEDELARTDIRHYHPPTGDKAAHVATCAHCGGTYIVGPGEPNICPRGHGYFTNPDFFEDDVRPIKTNSPLWGFSSQLYKEDMDLMHQRR